MNDFDFGFTAVDENELEIAQRAEKSTTTAVATQAKLDELYNAILPLLSNLKKNPEKEYILWPNRIEKVDQFEDKLRQIYHS